MALSAVKIVLEYVCPSLGLVMANLMWLAPFRDLQDAVAKGEGLGDLNPTPWAFMLGNCLGWSSYGVLISNWFVFWANYPGFLLSCWLNLGAVKLLYSSHHQEEARKSLVEYLSSTRNSIQQLQDDNGGGLEQESFLSRDEEVENGITDPTKTPTIPDVDLGNGTTATNESSPSSTSTQDNVATDWAKIVWGVTSQKTPAKTPHERLVIGIVIVWTVVLSAIGFYKHYASLGDVGTATAENVAQSIVGYVVNINLVFFYGAPLSEIQTVLTTRRSNALHFPTMTMNTLNAIFWTAYAIAVNDPFIYVPNGLGVILGTIQFFLWMVFPKTTEESNQLPTTEA